MFTFIEYLSDMVDIQQLKKKQSKKHFISIGFPDDVNASLGFVVFCMLSFFPIIPSNIVATSEELHIETKTGIVFVGFLLLLKI